MDQRSDEELLVAIGQDAGAFTEFYRRHVDKVIGFALRRARTPEDVADLVAAVFVEVIEAAPRFDPGRGRAVSWLLGVAANTLSAERRRQARAGGAARRLAGHRYLDPADYERVEERLDATAAARRVYAALGELSDREREIVALVMVDGLTPGDPRMTTPDRYPELRGFTERLLGGLHEVLAAERAARAASTPPPITHRRERSTMRRSLLRVTAAAAAAAVAAGGVWLAGGAGGPAPAPGAPPVAVPGQPAPVRSLADLALVVERQPAPAQPSGPVQAVLREELLGMRAAGEVDGQAFAYFIERRWTELRRRDGSVRAEYGQPKVSFLTARDRELYQRWYQRWRAGTAGYHNREDLKAGDAPPKPLPDWPEPYTWSWPAGEAAWEVAPEEHDGVLGAYQVADGRMSRGVRAADLPTDPAALERLIRRTIEPYAAASRSERDLVGKVGTAQELFMSFVLDLLADEHVTPAQRAAAFRMLEGVEGVTVIPEAADRAGREGIAIRWVDTRNALEDGATLWVFDRASGRLLGVEFPAAHHGPWRRYHGEGFKGYTVFLREEVMR